MTPQNLGQSAARLPSRIQACFPPNRLPPEKIAACKLLVERRGTQIDVSHHAGIFRVRGALKSKCEREIFLPIGEIRAHLVRAADQHYLSDTVWLIGATSVISG